MSAPSPPTVPQSRRLKGISHLLLDIEGTTCPASFVAEELFPYARRELPAFLRERSHEPQIRELLLETARHWQADPDPAAQMLWQQANQASDGRRIRNSEPGRMAEFHNQEVESHERGLKEIATQAAESLEAQPLLPEAVDERFLEKSGVDPLLHYLEWLISGDRKVTPLKELQGLIWQQGYANGHLKAPLYPDVTAALKRWHGAGVVLAVYSSGSVTAQRLLYGHSSAGDLQPLFRHWFDTRWGSKKEPQSYQKIASFMACPAEAVLFISDATAELEAAEASGMRVLFSDRDGNPERDPGRFESISTYTSLELQP
jgi:enolase-phosphatase E1